MHLPRRLGRLALVVLSSAFAAPALAAQTPLADLSPAPEVKRLEIRGVSKAVDITELRNSIYTGATSCRSFILTPLCRFTQYRGFKDRQYLDRQELKRDVLRIRVFYYKHGFREARVDTAVIPLNDRQVEVVFDIHEGPPTVVTEVRVSYDTAVLSAKKVQQLTLLKPGMPFDLFVYDSTRVFFQNELWERGYADALVDTSSIVDTVRHTARVQFRLVPNHPTTVGDIVVQGTQKVSSTTVLNALSFRPGDLYRRSAVLESQRNLYESNLFKLAVIEAPTTFDSIKTVDVMVREAPLHEARLNLGFNTVDFIQAGGRFTDHNLFGAARRFDISAVAGNLFASSLNGKGIFLRQTPDFTITGDAADFLRPTWQTSLTLTQPAFLHRSRNSLSLGAFAQRRAVPAVVIDNGYGGNLTYTRTVGFRAPASLSYNFEVTRVTASGVYFCVDFGVCDNTAIAALLSHLKLSPLVAQIQVDRSDQPLSATRGYRAGSSFEHASSFTASDYRYNRAYAEGSIYSRIGARSNVLAANLRLGFIRAIAGGPTSVLHPRKRFYAGGSQSVRGYGENQLGPRVLTLPPAFLAHSHTASGAPCDITTTAVQFCDPNFIFDTINVTLPAGDDKFTPRPVGGTSLLEGSIEYRFPLPIFSKLEGAVFIDGAVVGVSGGLDPLGAGAQTLANLVRGAAAITPGFGVRYLSGVGPIRVDLGYNPSRAEELAVITAVTTNGISQLVPLDIPRRYDPFAASTGIFGFLNRFTLHLSIGQAF